MNCNTVQTIGHKREVCVLHENTLSGVESPAIFDCNKGLDWATHLTLAHTKSGLALQYNETLAWSRKESWMVGYDKWHLKRKKVKTENVTYRTAGPLYSFLGSISQPFSSTFLTKSKFDRTDAAASVIIEWARCFPGQILKEGWYHDHDDIRRWDMEYREMLTSCRTRMQCPSGL